MKLYSGLSPDHEMRRDVMTWLLVSALIALTISRHEMWRDELQAWAIARASSSPWDLLDNTKWERHPPMWHFVLWLLSRLFSSPVAAQVLTFGISSTSCWILIRRFPASRTIRTVLAMGYFPLYELGVISRSWGLVMLLGLLLLVAIDRNSPKMWMVGALSVTLCLTETHAVPLVIGICVAVAPSLLTSTVRRWGVGIVSALLAVALIFLIPAPDGGDRRRMEFDLDIETLRRLRGALEGVARAIFPLQPPRVTFWYLPPPPNRIVLLVGVATVLLIAVLAVRSRQALSIWLISIGLLLALLTVFRIPFLPRQASVVWLTVLATFWRLQRTQPAWRVRMFKPLRRGFDGLVAVALSTSVMGAAWAVVTDLRAPFSDGEAVADWVRGRSDGEVVVLCGAQDWLCSTVSIRLNARLYMDDWGEGNEFVVFSRGRPKALNATELTESAHSLSKRLNVDVVVVQSDPPWPNEWVGCSDRWTHTRATISLENLSACMLSDLTPP